MFQKVDIKEVNETLTVNKLNINLAGDSKGQAFSENSAVPEDAAAGLQKIHIKDAVGTVGFSGRRLG